MAGEPFEGVIDGWRRKLMAGEPFKDLIDGWRRKMRFYRENLIIIKFSL